MDVVGDPGAPVGAVDAVAAASGPVVDDLAVSVAALHAESPAAKARSTRAGRRGFTHPETGFDALGFPGSGTRHEAVSGPSYSRQTQLPSGRPPPRAPPVRPEVSPAGEVNGIDLFLQRCFDGLANGAVYASLALALVIVYRSTGLLNIAQGEMATFSTYTVLVLNTPATPALAGTGLAAALLPFSPWPLWASILGGMVVGAALGALIERVVIRRIPNQSPFAVVSVSVALLLLINGLTERIWFPLVRGFPPPFPNAPADYVAVGPARLRYTTIGTWLTLIVILVLITLLLRYTKIGLAFRAVSSDREVSQLMGIPTGRILTLGWALAGAIGTVAGVLVAPTVLLEPDMMVRVLIFSLVAATLGGLDSMGGAVLGGLIVGLAQTMIGGYVGFFGSELSLPGAMLVMVVVLITRPTGLFGTRRVERV